ncbi:MAG: hypothetical protein HY552_00955 [Elusimicrobia bacterium]|nr:hypothetical protein [Elusimicrobiota bacterium]
MPFPLKKEGLLQAWAYALASVVFLLPVVNPDIWWHLSAGRWIWEHGAVPAADSFSFTRAGAPWIDFEWLFQLAVLAVHRAAGDWGLWALKFALLALAAWPTDGLLRDRGVSGGARVLATAAWAAGFFSKADLRPDLLSAAFFALLLRRLESGRASFLFGFGLFALWANLHGGFVLGLGLYAAAALPRRRTGRPPARDLAGEACGALLGACLNPFGLRLYEVFFLHAGDPAMRAFVAEWQAFSLRWSFHWPLAAFLPASLAAAWLRRREDPLLAAVAAAAAVAGIWSTRFTLYWAAAAAPLLAAALPRAHPAALALILAGLTALGARALRPVRLGLPFQDLYVARRAADFIAEQKQELGGLRLFNTYEWGGYLGWRTGAPVFGDGRYLFHGQNAAFQAALESPADLAAFLGKERLDGLFVRRFRSFIEGVRVHPDGSRVPVRRPWYLAFLPRERWALVYWDDLALVFVDRAKVAPAWLSAHEYRWWRPDDDEARDDALARGEIPRAAYDAERARQQSALKSH